MVSNWNEAIFASCVRNHLSLTIKITAMLVASKSVHHLIYQIIYIYKLKLCSRIIDSNLKVVSLVVAESSNC